MPNMTNYKPEDITPSMRKYLGMPDVAQDDGTSEGAKKGWATRNHNGGGETNQDSRIEALIDLINNLKDDDKPLNQIIGSQPRCDNKDERRNYRNLLAAGAKKTRQDVDRIHRGMKKSKAFSTAIGRGTAYGHKGFTPGYKYIGDSSQMF